MTPRRRSSTNFHVYPWPEHEREAWNVKFYWWAVHLFLASLIWLPLLAAIVCSTRKPQ